MKIVFFARLFAPHVGGVEKHIIKLSEVLQRKGYSITVITEGYKRGLPAHERIHNIDVHRIPVFNISEKNKKWQIWWWLFKNRKFFKDSDILHIHDVFYWYLPFRFLYPLKKIFITFHGYEGIDPPRFAAILQRKLGELVSSGTVNVGDYMKKWYHSNPTLVIYGAADEVGAKVKQKNRGIYLGRLKGDTGIMMYLHAMRILKKHEKDFPIDVYGDGPQRKAAEFYVKKHGLDVKFFGFVEGASGKIKHYKYAFVSRYLATIEAMQSKVFVCAVYDNQIKKDTLYCFPMVEAMAIAGAPEELARMLLRESGDHEEKIAKAFAWAKEQTWEKLVEKHIAMWNRGLQTGYLH